MDENLLDEKKNEALRILQTESQISKSSHLRYAEKHLLLLNEFEKYRMEISKNNIELYEDLLNSRSKMKDDHEWFAYMGYIERKKTLNEYNIKLKYLELRKSKLEEQISNQYGDIVKVEQILTNVIHELETLLHYVESAELHVNSSYKYYKMVSGQISKIDYENWLLENKKVGRNDDENYVRNLKKLFKESQEDSLKK